jgi:hypothetical protein
MIFGGKTIQFICTAEKHKFIFYPDLTAESFPAWTAKRPKFWGYKTLCEVQAVAGSGQGMYGPAAPCRHLLFHNYVPQGIYQDKTSGGKDYRIPCYWTSKTPGDAGCKAWPLEWLKYPTVWYDGDNRRVHLLAWVNIALCEGESQFYAPAAGTQVGSTDYDRATDEIINPKQCLVGGLGGEGGGPVFVGGSPSCYAYGRHKTKNVTRAIIHCEGQVHEVVGRLNNVDIEHIVFFYKPYIVATFADQTPNGPVSDIFPELRVDDSARYSNPTGDKEYHNVSSRVGSPCFAVEGDLGDMFSLKTFITTPYRLMLKMLEPSDPRGGMIVDTVVPDDGKHGLFRDVFLLGKGSTMLHIATEAHFNFPGRTPTNTREEGKYGPIDFRNEQAPAELNQIDVTLAGAGYPVSGHMEWAETVKKRSETIANWQRNDDCKEQGGPSKTPNNQTTKTPARDLDPIVDWKCVVNIPLNLPISSPYTSNPLANPVGRGPAPGSMRANPDTYQPSPTDDIPKPDADQPWPFPGGIVVAPWDDDDRVWDPYIKGCRTSRTGIQGSLFCVDEFGIYDGRDIDNAKVKFTESARALGPYFSVDTTKYDWLQLDETQLPGATTYATIQEHLGAIWATLKQFGKILTYLTQNRQIGLATITSLDPLKICPCNKDGQTAATVETEAHDLSPESVVMSEKVIYFKDCEGKTCITKIPQGFSGFVSSDDFSWPADSPGSVDPGPGDVL